jgi:glycopeptide antibiotics resistance protein
MPSPLSTLNPDDFRALLELAVALVLAVTSLAAGHRRLARIIWGIALVLVTVPFTDLHGHTHWAIVGWIPFVTPPVKFTDIAANVIIYVPFGFLAARRRSAGSMVLRTVGLTLALSFALELTQLFSHSRFPSSTDMVSDAIGAAAGAFLSWRKGRG